MSQHQSQHVDDLPVAGADVDKQKHADEAKAKAKASFELASFVLMTLRIQFGAFC